MKKLTIAVCILGAWVAAFYGLRFYNDSKSTSQLSAALGEAKTVWVELQDTYESDGTLPYMTNDESGRRYQVLRPEVSHRLNNQILAVTWNALGDHGHIVIYQSGKSEVRTSEELVSQLLEEIKSDEMVSSDFRYPVVHP